MSGHRRSIVTNEKPDSFKIDPHYRVPRIGIFDEDPLEDLLPVLIIGVGLIGLVILSYVIYRKLKK